MRLFVLAIVGLLAACAGPKLPAPNSADVRYDGRDRAAQVMVSSLQPPTAAALIANDGTRYPASGIALVASALIPVPPDYDSNWSRYCVEISAGAQPMSLAAPAPAGSRGRGRAP
jgi:hypothetical protein